MSKIKPLTEREALWEALRGRYHYCVITKATALSKRITFYQDKPYYNSKQQKWELAKHVGETESLIFNKDVQSFSILTQRYACGIYYTGEILAQLYAYESTRL